MQDENEVVDCPCCNGDGSLFKSELFPPHKASEDRTKVAASAGMETFWITVKHQFPEITTGDMPPDALASLDEAMRKAIALWVSVNKPEAK